MNSLLPLLATPAAPFASEAYLWEVKWDGMRALAASEGGPWRQWAKGHRLYRTLPGAGRAGRLPAGTVLDGGLVVLQNGQADFPALPRRHQRQHPNPLGATACHQRLPVGDVRFDLLFDPVAQSVAGSAGPAAGTLAGVALGWDHAGLAGKSIMRFGIALNGCPR